jgi:hypothetical protein
MYFSRGTIAGFLVLAAAWAGVLSAVSWAQAGHRPVLVDYGKVGQYQWAVGVIRDSGKQGGRRPCVAARVLDTVYGGPNDFSQEKTLKLCSALAVASPPNIVSLSSGEGGKVIEVFGIAAVPAIRTIEFDFGGAGMRSIRMKQLNAIQMRNAGVRSLRYGAIAMPTLGCLRQVKGYGVSGNLVYSGPIEECLE